MKKMVMTLVVILFVFTTLGAVHGAELSVIQVEGLEKTRESTVCKIIRFQEGDEISMEDLDLIRQRLLRAELFINEEIRADLELDGEGNAVLSLYLADRISLVPIPFAAAGSGGAAGGFFLTDNNFMGTGDVFLAGGMVSEDSRFFSLSYTDRNSGGSSWNLGGAFHYSGGDTSITTAEDEELYSYESTVLGASVSGIWSLRPWTLHLRGGLSGADYDFMDDWITVYSPSVSLSFGRLYFSRYMSEGFKAEAGYGLSIYSERLDISHTLDLEILYQKLLASRIQAELIGRTQNYQGEELLSPRLESDILPDTVRAENQFMIRGGLQFVLMDFSWGYLGLPLGYEAGLLDGISADDELYHGPSAALTLNLKKLAIPAISISYGYNIETDDGVLRFNIGFSR